MLLISPFWYGLIVGGFLGSAAMLLFVAPLVPRVEDLEDALARRLVELNELREKLERNEIEIRVLYRMVPAERLMQYFEAPYESELRK